jgi:hypothetical protein
VGLWETVHAFVDFDIYLYHDRMGTKVVEQLCAYRNGREQYMNVFSMGFGLLK